MDTLNRLCPQRSGQEACLHQPGSGRGGRKSGVGFGSWRGAERPPFALVWPEVTRLYSSGSGLRHFTDLTIVLPDSRALGSCLGVLGLTWPVRACLGPSWVIQPSLRSGLPALPGRHSHSSFQVTDCMAAKGAKRPKLPCGLLRSERSERSQVARMHKSDLAQTEQHISPHQ